MHELQNKLNDIFGLRPTDKAKASARAREKAQRLARQHSITIKQDIAGGWWVDMHPEPTFDPIDGNHFCATWEEVLVTVETCVDYLTH